MELQLAVQSARSSGRHRPVEDTPSYLKPSAGSSCHHACKYGGPHTSEDQKDAHCRAQPKPRKQPPPAVVDQQKRSLIRVRLVPRKLLGGRSRGDEKVEKAGAEREEKPETMEWKDVVALTAHGSLPELDQHRVMGSGDVKKTRGNRSHDKPGNAQHVDGVRIQDESLVKKLVDKSVGSKMTSNRVPREPTHKDVNTDTKSVKPPPPRGKKPSVLVARKMAVDQELVDGYQPVSPSLLQKRASLLRDLEEEMVHHESSNMNGFKTTTYSLDQEEHAAAAASETSRPIPAHRRVKSMSISSRSVRFPFTRQASRSRSSATFKLRSKSSKEPILPSEEEKPARLRSRRGSVGGGGDETRSTGRGVQLRIRSLRRRGFGDTSTGFVVTAVSLRHQKTLEKKRSQRLYNNLIEETASKLVKARNSRVKALVGAFESVISKIAK